MSNNLKELDQLLNWLGLSEYEVAIYRLLLKHGDLTILEIARLLHLPRTSIYRKLENMKQNGLVEEVIDEFRTKAHAVEWNKIEYLVKQKQAQGVLYTSLLPSLKDSIEQLTQQAQSFTNVRFYRGQEGVARMTWGALQTKDIFMGYTHRQFSELIGIKQAKEFREEWNITGKAGREIYSDAYKKSLAEHPEMDTGKWNNWEMRYISPTDLNIDHQFDIYNDVVAIYNWYEGEIFGIQITNEKIASFQKQLFDLVWKMANKINTNFTKI